MATTPQIGDPDYKPGGLISVPSSGPQTTGYNPATATATEAKATGYDPKATTVQSNDTVQGQIKGLIDQDSPLMQQAARRAAESANSRGLLNSSMAIGAGQSAVYDAALPIAQQDASTYFTANQKTVDATNAARNFGAAANNQASLANAQLGTDVSKSNAASVNEAAGKSAAAANQSALAQLDVDTRKDLATQDVESRLQLANLDSATRLQLQNLDAQSRMQLSTIENQYRQLLQANTNAASMYSQAVAAIGNISSNPNMSQPAKDNAIQTQLNMLQEAFRATQEITRQTPATVSSLNLSQFFNEGATTQLTPEQITKQLAPYQAAVDSAQAAIPVWGQNQLLYVAPPGPNQSERTAANFNALYSQRYQEYQQRVAEYNAAKAQYA